MAQVTLSDGVTSYACPEDDTILRAALRNGLGFPYECNVGSCGNCKFELVEGEVEHLRADAPGWTEKDKQRKRYLGCQARPIGDCRIKVGLRDHYKSHFKPQQVRGQLTAVEDLTHDIREFRFKLDRSVPFLPGQYALLYVPGVEGARAYSMSNVTETGEEWHFQIKLMPGGAATTKLFGDLKIGDRIGLDGPYGMAYLRTDAPRDILCLAGGSGLSPMISISRGKARTRSLDGRQLHFIYGGRTARDICGEAALSILPGWNKEIFYHPAISMPQEDGGGWTGKTGFVTDVAKDMFGAKLADMEIYFAGPPAMANAVMKLVVEMKIPPAQVHYDQFF